jgi:hypothetical protein
MSLFSTKSMRRSPKADQATHGGDREFFLLAVRGLRLACRHFHDDGRFAYFLFTANQEFRSEGSRAFLRGIYLGKPPTQSDMM